MVVIVFVIAIAKAIAIAIVVTIDIVLAMLLLLLLLLRLSRVLAGQSLRQPSRCRFAQRKAKQSHSDICAHQRSESTYRDHNAMFIIYKTDMQRKPRNARVNTKNC